MKLTEQKLRQIIQNEIRMVNEKIEDFEVYLDNLDEYVTIYIDDLEEILKDNADMNYDTLDQIMLVYFDDTMYSEDEYSDYEVAGTKRDRANIVKQLGLKS